MLKKIRFLQFQFCTLCLHHVNQILYKFMICVFKIQLFCSNYLIYYFFFYFLATTLTIKKLPTTVQSEVPLMLIHSSPRVPRRMQYSDSLLKARAGKSTDSVTGWKEIRKSPAHFFSAQTSLYPHTNTSRGGGEV